MRYMGGKSRIAKRIAPFLIADGIRCHTYLEPFIGGGSVFAEVALHFEKAIGADVVPDLVMLWQAVAEGWDPPETITREEWEQLRIAEPSATRGLAGFGSSFGSKWFGGYARGKKPNGDPRNYTAEARRNLLGMAPLIRHATFELASYDAWSPGEGVLVYCDPPYAGTTTYGATDAFDSERFWTVAESWAEAGATVFVSEYAAPDHWTEVWSAPVQISLKVQNDIPPATERLFTL